MKTNYEELFPKNRLLYNLKDLEQYGVMKVSMAKKLVLNRQIEIVKIGSKLHVSRQVLIDYLKANTIEAI